MIDLYKEGRKKAFEEWSQGLDFLPEIMTCPMIDEDYKRGYAEFWVALKRV